MRPAPAAVVVEIGDARIEVTAGADRGTLALVFEALTTANGKAR
jgi:hypothetical protein